MNKVLKHALCITVTVILMLLLSLSLCLTPVNSNGTGENIAYNGDSVPSLNGGQTKPTGSSDINAIAADNAGIKQVVTGYTHTLVLFNNGKVFGTGNEALGLETSRVIDKYTEITSLSGLNVTKIATADRHSLAIADGKLYAAGSNSLGQLGMGDENECKTFVEVTSLSGKYVTDIACSGYHSMIIADGKVYTSGYNDYGQLGVGNISYVNKFTEVNSLSGKNVTAIACGNSHSMAIADNYLYVAGDNSRGQLGKGYDNYGKQFDSFTLSESMSNRPVTDIAAGNYHSLAISDNTLYTTGQNNSGQLGLGDRGESYYRSSFEEVTNISNVTHIAAGDEFSFAVANGKTYATGSNDFNQLGVSYEQCIFTEIETFSGKNVTAMDGGFAHSMAIADGVLYGCGDSEYGQLGIGESGYSGAGVSNFTELPLKYTIYFESNDGNGYNDMQEIMFYQSDKIKSNSFSREGCTFAGWSTELNGSVVYTDEQELPAYFMNIDETLTLYGAWTMNAPTGVDYTSNIGGYTATYNPNSNIKLTAKVKENYQMTYTYQWYKNNVKLGGQTNKTIVLSNVSDSGEYKVEVIGKYLNQTKSTMSAAKNINISRANISPSIAINGWTYGDSANVPIISGNTGNGTVSYLYTGTANDGSQYNSSSAPTLAGTYNLNATIAETANYNGGSSNVSFIISKANISPTVTLNNWVYGNTANIPNIMGNAGNGTVSYLYTGTANDGTVINTAIAPTLAGNYNLNITIAETANYNGGSTNVNFTIAKANISPSIILDGWTFGESANIPSITGNAGSGAITYLYTGTINDGTQFSSATAPNLAGNYILNIIIAETANYNGGSTDMSFIIHRADLLPTVSISDWIYGEQANAPILSGNLGNGTITYIYTGTANNGSAYSSDNAPALAGNYNLKVTIAETANYNAGYAEAAFNIERAKITPPVIESKVFTNSNLKADVADTDRYTVTMNAGGIAKGNYDVILTLTDFCNYEWYDGTNVSGENNENATLVFTITGAQNSWVTAPSIDNVIYGTRISVVYEAFYGNETVIVVYKNEAGEIIDKPIAAGAYKAIFTITATEDYSGLDAIVEFTIGKRDISVTIDNKTSVYGDNIKELSCRLTGGELAYEDALNELGIVLTKTNGENAGRYVITGVNNDANYNIEFIDGIYTIFKADYANVTHGAFDGVYNPNKSLAEYQLDNGYIWADASIIPNVAAKEYKAYYNADPINYNDYELFVIINLSKAYYDTSNLVFESATVIFDGESHSLEVKGLPANVTVEYEGNDKRDAGIYTITAKFLGDYENYNVIDEMTATLTINYKQINSDNNEVYIESDKGLAHNVKLNVKDVTAEMGTNKIDGMTIGQAYDITILEGENTVQPDGALIVKMLINESLRGRDDLKVYYLDSDGNATDMLAKREGEYMVFATNHFSTYVIAHSTEIADGDNSNITLGIVVGVIAGVVILSVIIGFVIKKKRA